jgi:predicted lipid-binding transport protein (Tim44 family)
MTSASLSADFSQAEGVNIVWLDILIFAGIALFLGFKLRSVLGERTGHEKPPETYQIPQPDERASQAPAPSPVMDAPKPIEYVPPKPMDPAPDSLAGRLRKIELADPRFNEKAYLSGVKVAFEMIVSEFAEGDTAGLRPLLADDVYDNFVAAIRDRTANQQTLSTKVLRIKDASIEEAEMVINTAKVTVKIVSEQIQVLKDNMNNILEGHPTNSREVVDIWTFSRNTRASDPNWQLASTRGSD